MMAGVTSAATAANPVWFATDALCQDRCKPMAPPAGGAIFLCSFARPQPGADPPPYTSLSALEFQLIRELKAPKFQVAFIFRPDFEIPRNYALELLSY